MRLASVTGCAYGADRCEGLDDWDAIELDVLHARTAFIDEFAGVVALQLDCS
jgi:hypothetical protein